MKSSTINEHLREYKKKCENFESKIIQIIDIYMENY